MPAITGSAMTGVQTDTVNRVTVSSRNIVRTGYFSFILYVPNVSVEVEARFGADNLERLVGSHFHRLFLASLSKSFPRGRFSLF